MRRFGFGFRGAAKTPRAVLVRITSANPSGSFLDSNEDGIPDAVIGGTLTADVPVTWSVTGADASFVALNAASGVWTINP